MFPMADYPKYFRKDDKTKVANRPADAVKLRFEGYKEVSAEEVEGSPAAPSVSADSQVPELTEAEMAKLPEAKGAEVVDTTGDAVPSEQTNRKPRSQR
jgi:hypothetical protein